MRYSDVIALKLAQLGVDLVFQGRGCGAMIVADVIGLAIKLSRHVGRRYVSLDAKPDLVEWYQGPRFEINKLKQKQRIAAEPGKISDDIPVSMRFDLREV